MSNKIAIIQEQNYHTEVLAFFLNYFIKNNYIIDIFFNYINDNTSYIKYYLDSYENNNLKIYKINDFNNKKDNYNIILLTTKPSFSNFNKIPKNKTLLYCHFLSEAQYGVINLCTTPLINSPYYNFTLIEPFFNPIFKIKDNLTKTILIIGNFEQKNLEDLKNSIDEFSLLNYRFILISRKIPKDIINHKNITIKQNLLTNELIDIYQNQIDYFLLLNKKDSFYHKDRISGGVFQALSYRIPIICDKEYDEIYKYPESIVYKNSISEILYELENISIDQYNSKRIILDYFINNKIISYTHNLDKIINFLMNNNLKNPKKNININKKIKLIKI